MRALFVAALAVVSAPFMLLGQRRPGEQPARVTALPQQPAPQAFIYAVTASPEPHLRVVRDLPGSVWLWDLDQRTGRVLLGSRRARAGIRGQLAGDTKERELGWLDYSLAADISADGKTLLLTDEGDSASRSYSIFLRSAEDRLPMPLDELYVVDGLR